MTKICLYFYADCSTMLNKVRSDQELNRIEKDKGGNSMLTVSILLDSVEKVQRFVSVISKYSCAFDIQSGHSYVDAKSLVGIFSLDISQPLHLTINGGGTEMEDILRDVQEFMEY